METFQANSVSLSHLLRTIHEGELALPDFQRDFVWDARATEELIESIARSFPAGSLLFMPWRPDAFAPRAIQAAPPLDGTAPSKLILDGQQRLSSLYQACYGVGEYRYFVDLNPLLEDDNIGEAVFYRHKNRCGPYRTEEQQAERLILPLGVLFGGDGGGFHDWRDRILELRQEEDAALVELRQALQGVYRKHIRPLEDYRFPVVTLDQDTDLEAVCSIFETLNRTGIRLSVFDLLAARFYAQGLDLRRQWEETVATHAVIDDFEVNRYYLLQSIALRVRGSVKRGDVLRLSVPEVEEHWEIVTRAYRMALEMLRDECGVRTSKWLPYGYLLVPMAAIWPETIEEVDGPASAANRERLKRWFWCSGFSQTYDRAANTQAAKDFTELRAWLTGGDPPSTVADFEFDPSRLREITPKQQSIYKAMMAMVLRHGALDFHHGRTLTTASIAAQGVDDHHIFPRAYLNPSPEESAVPSQLVDCILNRTMIDADTNRRIGRRAPSDYLSEVKAELDGAGASVFERVLESHLLPTGDGSPLLGDDFHAFAVWREERLCAEISVLTGVDVATSEAQTA